MKSQQGAIFFFFFLMKDKLVFVIVSSELSFAVSRDGDLSALTYKELTDNLPLETMGSDFIE